MTQLESQYDLAIGRLLLDQGDLQAALAWCDRTWPRLHARGEHLAAGRMLDLRAFCLLYCGEADAALESADRSLAIAETIGDAYGLAFAQLRRSRILIALGRTAEARPLIERALTVAEAGGGPRDEGYLLDRLAMVEMIEGNAAAALAALRRALAQTAAEDDRKLQVDLRHNLVLATLMTGAAAEVERLFAEPPQATNLSLDMERQLIHGLILLARGDSTAAATIAGEVAAQAAATGYALYGITAARLLAATVQPPPLAALARLLWVVRDDAPANTSPG